MAVFFIVLWHFSSKHAEMKRASARLSLSQIHSHARTLTQSLKRIRNVFFIRLLYKYVANVPYTLHSAHMFHTRLYVHGNGWRPCLCMCHHWLCRFWSSINAVAISHTAYKNQWHWKKKVWLNRNGDEQKPHNKKKFNNFRWCKLREKKVAIFLWMYKFSSEWWLSFFHHVAQISQ